MRQSWLLGLASLAIGVPAAAQEDRGHGGFYGGPVLGLDHFAAEDEDGNDDSTGVIYGGLIGYDFASADAVFGLEAELSESSISESEASVFVPGDRLRFGAGLDLYLGGRAGIRLGTGGLLYLKAGYTNLDLNARYQAPGINSVSETEALDGIRVGAGGEFALTRNLVARLEYRYSSYDTGEAEDGFDDFDIKRHQAVGGVLFRF